MDVQEEKRRDPSPGDESFGTGSGVRRDRSSSCTESAGSRPRIQLPASCVGHKKNSSRLLCCSSASHACFSFWQLTCFLALVPTGFYFFFPKNFMAYKKSLF